MRRSPLPAGEALTRLTLKICLSGAKKHLRADMELDAYCPYSGAELDLITGEFKNAEPIPAAKKQRETTPYIRLKAASDRLQRIIRQSQGLSNKELAAMADTLNNLCSKWEQS